MTEPDRTPYCTKIRYGISGAPTLTEDEMDGSHAPGVGVKPTLIELVYSAARGGKPASVAASVTGDWMRFGKRDGGQVTTHFKNGPDGWPAWLAAEARLHDPDAVSAVPAPATAEEHRLALSEALGLGTGAPWDAIHDRVRTLRTADESAREGWEQAAIQRSRATAWREEAERAEAEVKRLRIDRATVLREAADLAEEVAESLRKHHEFERSTGALDVMTELRRVAAEPAPADTGHDESSAGHALAQCPDIDHCPIHGTLRPNPDTEQPAAAQQPKEARP